MKRAVRRTSDAPPPRHSRITKRGDAYQVRSVAGGLLAELGGADLLTDPDVVALFRAQDAALNASLGLAPDGRPAPPLPPPPARGAPELEAPPPGPGCGELRATWEHEYKLATGAPYRWRGVSDKRGIDRAIEAGVDLGEFAERSWRALRAEGDLRCKTIAKMTSLVMWSRLTRLLRSEASHEG